MKSRKTTLLVIGTCIITVILTVTMMRWWFFRTVQPVELSQTETQVLEKKLQALGADSFNTHTKAGPESEPELDNMEPEPYSENPALREVVLSERELNGLIARDPQFAHRVVIDLAPDLASTKILLPIPEDFPIFSGKTLRIHAGLELRIENERPIVMLRGVSLMGVPIPNAWLGGLKNIDLVEEYGNAGFWKAFAEGLESIEVRESEVFIKLRP